MRYVKDIEWIGCPCRGSKKKQTTVWKNVRYKKKTVP